MKLTTIFACECQPIVIEGLLRVLERCQDLQLSGSATTIETALQRRGPATDVFLLGQPPGAKSPLPLLTRARQVGVTGNIVLWTSDMSDMDAFRALQMGARGVLNRTDSLECLIDCMRMVGRGDVWLRASNGERTVRPPAALRITPRERQILELVCEGLRNREIAERMSITPGTVKVHLMHIFEKTGMKDRFQLALQGRQLLAGVPVNSTPPRERTAVAEL